jgi:hypothetical protein
MVPGSAWNWIAVKESNFNKKEKIENMTSLHSRKSIDRSPLRQVFRFGALALVLAWCTVPTASRAALPPPTPDGGYPNFNTAEGDAALSFLTSGQSNTAVGWAALNRNTTGNQNTGIGTGALQFNSTGSGNTALGFGTKCSETGNQNTATGFDALGLNSSGNFNTANGALALTRNTGSNNTAMGYNALTSDSTVSGLTAIGSGALQMNNTGFDNTAVGFQALQSNTSGEDNTATGSYALNSNTDGFDNTANGFQALTSNTHGGDNTATGFNALSNNTIGTSNTAIGFQAGVSNVSGNNNTASGEGALTSNTIGSSNTATGFNALFRNTGSTNIAIGALAGQNLTTGNNNIDIGHQGVAGDSGKIRIGTPVTHTATFIAGIYNVSEGGTIKPVYINSNGRLGTQPPASARKFKEEIKAMEKTSEGILKLKPVTFRYKNDEERTPQFGLIAEDVANMNPDLVVRDENGEIYTVRYDAVNAMLLNEFLKEHKTVQEQGATITALRAHDAKQEAVLAQQQKQIDALTAGLQKVSAQLELSKPAPQTALNNQ